MKRLILIIFSLCITLIIQAQVTKTVTNTAGGLSTALTPSELNTVTNLTLTGTIDARDFKTMRDSMPLLAELDISSATIADYLGLDGTVSYNFSNYFPENAIPECAFCNQDTRIGKSSLTSVNLPSSITAIRYWAFYGCTGLTSVSIPSLVTSIGSAAFLGCTGLTSVTLPPSVASIDDYAFMLCSGLTSITIPSTITSFRNYVFSHCTGLTSIVIPSSVTSIGSNALACCNGLTSINIPSSVTSIGSQAFYMCQNLSSIYANGANPVDISSSPDVFEYINKTFCVLYVPYGTSGLYATADKWKEFTNIVEMSGVTLFSVNEVIEAAQGSTATIDISSDVTWTATSNQSWLTVTPTTGTGMKQKLTFTAEANASTNDPRVAIITISAPNQPAQTVTVTQKITIDPSKLDAFESDNSVDNASIIKSGDIQQHSIYPFNDIDYASFELTNAPAQVEINIITISNGRQIQLLMADGNTVLYTGNTIINTTLTQNGKYYIKAWNPDNLLIPEYQLSLKINPILVDKYEPDNTWEEARLIVPFTEQDDHTIKGIGDVDFMKFNITDAPRTIYVEVTDNQRGGKSFGIWLYDTDGTTLLNYSNTPNNNSSAYQEYTFTANGTYFLKVALPQGESGSTRDNYTINLTTNGVAPSINCNPTDSLALVAIYNTLNGVNWNRKQSWLTDKVQNWQGVTLSSEGRVTKLNLTMNNLHGSIPTEIGQLTAIRFLNLGNMMYVESRNGANQLTNSTLPTSMTNLVNLEVLSLDGLGFNSELPDVFSGMAKLRELYLDLSGFTNTQLPMGILSCSKLERLAIDNNRFSELPNLSGLTNLQGFLAFANSFTFEDIEPNWAISGFNYSSQNKIGSIHTQNPPTGTLVTHSIEVGGAHNLYQWYKNDVPIPGQTSNTLRIEKVSIADAGIYHLRITNTLITQLTLYSEPLTLYQKELPVYKALEAFYCSTGGANWINKTNWLSDAPISSWFGIYFSESGNYRIGLPFNNLIGQLPESIGDLTLFTSISISSNPQLTGSIPENIGNLDRLQVLILESNGLNGEIPSSIGNLKNLYQLFLGHNQFSGSVPATIVNCSNLWIVGLNDNNLENLPNLSAMSQLFVMSLDNNKFEFDDLIPTHIGNPNMNFNYNPQKQFGKEETYKKQPGEALTVTATVGGTGNMYQWYKDSNLLNGETTNTLTFASLAFPDQGTYTCTVTNPAVPNLTLESKKMTVEVNQELVAGVSINVNENNVCAGTPVTFTAIPVNGGTAPSYKWYLNNVAVASGAGGTYVPKNGDVVYVVMTSDLPLVTDSPATSNAITMVVNQVPVGSASISVNRNNLNPGTPVTFTASSTGGGTTPAYKWFLNNVAVASGDRGTYVPTNGDVIYAEMTPDLPCSTNSIARSNSITMVVNQTVAASVSISVSQNNVCADTPVTFTANPVNGGTAPTYSWYLNNVAVATGVGGTYVPKNGDAVYVVMTSSLPNATGNPATSNVITMVVDSPVALPGYFTEGMAYVTPGLSDIRYTVPYVANMTYSWSYSGTGATITGTSNSVLISFSATVTSGALSVRASNSCGTSNPRSGNITVGNTLKAGIISDAVEQGTIEIPSAKNELKVYPNPASGPVTFEFQINEDAKATLDILSITGQQIARIFDADAQAGITQTVVYAEPLPSGVYLYILRWKDQTITGKSIITK